ELTFEVVECWDICPDCSDGADTGWGLKRKTIRHVAATRRTHVNDRCQCPPRACLPVWLRTRRRRYCVCSRCSRRRHCRRSNALLARPDRFVVLSSSESCSQGGSL